MLTSWAEVLDTTPCEDEIPEGWQTTKEIAEELGVSEATVGRQVREAMRNGKVEKKRFRIKSGRGLYPVPHYRIIDNET